VSTTNDVEKNMPYFQGIQRVR